MMKKILITGAGGFIGSHLAEHCVEQGCDVKAFVRYNSMNRWGWLDSSSAVKDMEVIPGDIRDYDSVHQAIKGCDTVFHLAALIGIPYSYVSPLAYIRTNVEGTYNVLQAAKEESLQNILITSTSETYGTAQYVPIDEKHPLVAQSPYSASKISADQMALSFFRSFQLPVKVVRPFNTFGPRQSARAIIPTIITQILAEKREIQLGNTAPTRDFTYVKDVVAGFLAIAKAQELWGEVTNIGSNQEISVGNLAQLIASLMGQKIAMREDVARVRPQQGEVERLWCDNTKIQTKTSWRIQHDIRAGLLETIEWFKKNRVMYKVDIYNV